MNKISQSICKKYLRILARPYLSPCLFLAILFLLTPLSIQADGGDLNNTTESAYKVYDRSGKKITEYEVLEIWKESEYHEPLNQGKWGTCYGHAAYQLLQHYYNKTMGPGKLNIVDILGKGCRRDYRESGLTAAVLFNIREDFNRVRHHETSSTSNSDLSPNKKGSGLIVENFPISYKKLFTNVNKIRKFHSTEIRNNDQEIEACSQFIFDNVLDEELVTRIKNDDPNFNFDWIKKTIEQEINEGTEQTFPFRVVNRLASSGKSINLPNYNIYFDEPTDTIDAIKKLKIHFSNSRTATPVAFGFCADARGDKCIPGHGHAVVITGTRKVCSLEGCHEEWKVINSYGTEGNIGKAGWLIADKLARKLDDYAMKFTYIQQCGTSQSESCVDFIKGRDHEVNKQSLNIIVAAGNLPAMKSYFKSKELESDETKSALQEAALTGAINHNQANLVSYLMKNSTETIHNYSNLQRAVELGNEDLLSKLKEDHRVKADLNKHRIKLIEIARKKEREAKETKREAEESLQKELRNQFEAKSALELVILDQELKLQIAESDRKNRDLKRIEDLTGLINRNRSSNEINMRNFNETILSIKIDLEQAELALDRTTKVILLLES